MQALVKGFGVFMLEISKCISLLIKRLSDERGKYSGLLMCIIYGYLFLLSVLQISLYLKLKACAWKVSFIVASRYYVLERKAKIQLL